MLVAPSPEPTPEPTVPPAPRPKPVIAESDSAPSLLHRSTFDDDLATFSAGLPTQLPAEMSAPVATPDDSGVLVYEQRQIQALGARSVFDVLDVVPGLTVSRDVQGFYRVAVRGIRSDPEVLFLIDGHPLNDVYDGRALANLPVDNLGPHRGDPRAGRGDLRPRRVPRGGEPRPRPRRGRARHRGGRLLRRDRWPPGRLALAGRAQALLRRRRLAGRTASASR